MVKQNAVSSWLLKTLIVLYPVIFLITTITISGYNFTEYKPASSDEKYYWHQILTFNQAGLNGGYYSIEERPAKLSISHFYTKGPLFPAIYGSIAKLIGGWQHNTGVILNVVLFIGALAAFLYSTKPDTRQLVMLFIALITFWPLWLFVHKTMMETALSTAAVLTGIIFYNALKLQERISLRQKYLFILILIFFALMRGGTWSALFIPFFIITAPSKKTTTLLMELIKGVVFTALSFWLFSQVLLPASNPASKLPTSRADLALLPQQIMDNIANLTRGHPLWIMQRLQLIVVAVISMVAPIRTIYSRRSKLNEVLVGCDQWIWESIFHLINLGGNLAANVILYDIFDWRDYRVLAPHLLLSLLLFIAFKRYRMALVVIVSNLLLISGFLFGEGFIEVWDNINAPNYEIQTAAVEGAPSLSELIVYDPEATSSWCNTLLLTDPYLIFDIDFTEIQGGIGVSYTRNIVKLPWPPKSRYVIFKPEELLDFQNSPELEPIGMTMWGALYKNVSVHCP